MDSPNLSDAIIREIGEQFMAGLRRMGPELLESDFDGIEQRLQDLGRRVMGEVVESVVSTLAAEPLGEPPSCPTCQRRMRLVEVDGAQVHLDDDWHEAKVGLAVALGPQTTTDPNTGRQTLAMGKPS